MKRAIALVSVSFTLFSLLGCTTPQPDAAAPDAAPSASADPGATVPNESRKPIDLTDEVQAGSDFDQFRAAVRQAVKNRDAAFVKTILPPEGVAIGFGRPMTVDELTLEDPDSMFWKILNKATAVGCAQAEGDYPTVDAGSDVWECANVTNAFYEQYPKPLDSEGVAYEISHVIVVGDRVEVKAQPESTSPTVTTLSNEVVNFDTQTWEAVPPETRADQLNSLDSWTPILLPNQQKGYVQNRYAYHPLEARVLFGKVKGAWQIIQIPSGD